MSKTKYIFAVFFIFMLVATPASGRAAGVKNPYESAITTARSEIWQDINSGRCGSATVAIMVDGSVVYAEGFGMADREKGIPVGINTIFNIGSISKVHVATAVMLLVDEGKVSLDSPVTNYLPEFRMADDRYRKITVRMLLNHTSGLPGTEMANTFGFQYNYSAKQETIDTLSRSHLKHTPGENAPYCNDGFTLAEMIVERVSGMKYIDFLNKRMFKPLGLKNTGLAVGETKGKTVALYYEAATGKKHPLETVSILGAGGLSSTAVELCRFADIFSAKGKLLKESSVAEMKKAQPSAFKGKLRNSLFSYGLGWDMTSLPRYAAAGIQIMGKSGGTGNYTSMVFTVPEKRISVAVIATGAASSAMKMALDIMDAVLVGKQLIAKEEKPVIAPPAAQKLPPEDVSLGGYYASDSKFGQLVFNADKNSATFYAINGQEKTPAMTVVYNNGYYHDGKGNWFYLAGAGGENYFVNYIPLIKIDTIAVQKVKPVEKPQTLRINMEGKVWLRRNVAPYEAAMATISHIEKSSLYKDLPGYVFFQGLKRINSPESAGMPFDAIRDQSELALFEKSGTTWTWISGMLYSPSESAAVLKDGENTVKIGSEGYNEWLAAGDGLILSFSKPDKGRIIVFSPDDNTIYDSAVDAGEVYIPKGGYVECAGIAGNVFKVKARTAAADKNR